MRMRITICPFCFRELKNGGGQHIYTCKSKGKHNIGNEKISYIEYNFPYISKKSNLIEEYINNNKSLPDLKKEFNIPYKTTVFLLKKYGIKVRDISDSAKSISVPKQRKLMSEKYGLEWGSQLEYVKEKKRQGCIDKYGVDNIWKSDWFKDNLDNFFIEKYGMTNSEYKKKLWEGLDNNEQRERMLNSALSSSSESKIESKVKTLLDLLNVSYISQFSIKNKKSIYFFDICIGKLLIEINGDFWHANPEKYEKNDILNFPGKKVLAKDIWEKDKIKKEIATKKGYNVVYLWEGYIRNTNNEIIIEKIKEIIKNNLYGNKKS